MIESLIELFHTNDVFSGVAAGGILTTLVASLLYIAKQTPAFLYNICKRYFTITTTIYSKESLYKNFNKWFTRFNDKSLRTYQFKSGSYNEDAPHIEDYNNEKFLLTPGIGKHFVWYKHTPILIEKEIYTENIDGVIEKISITTLGRSKKIVNEILYDVDNIINYNDKLKTFNQDNYNNWMLHIINKVPLSTIIYKKKNDIVQCINNFFNKKEWYYNIGLRYKLGVLLSGQPGTGKSKLVSAIASHLNLALYILNLNSIKNDSDLNEIIQHIPPKSILLIEDIDCFSVSNDREKEINKKEDGLSLSGLLNVLDGLNSPDGVIYIITTNYPDSLDKALIRPGRIDHYYELTDFDMDDMKEMYNLYINDNNFDELYKELGVETINPSMFQNILLNRIK